MNMDLVPDILAFAYLKPLLSLKNIFCQIIYLCTSSISRPSPGPIYSGWANNGCLHPIGSSLADSQDDLVDVSMKSFVGKRRHITNTVPVIVFFRTKISVGRIA
ncbi:hypothetical protein ACKS0A_02712 [Histoplasma ohiense]